MILDRMGDDDFLAKDIIKKLFEMSDKNPKKLLINAYKVCKKAVEEDADVVKDSHIKDALKETVDISLFYEDDEDNNVDTDVCPVCHEKLMKIGDYWRCPNCDTFCGACGAIVDEDDEVCPECGARFEN